jgi:hypothetical protein
MNYQVICLCGNIVPVSASMAGSEVACRCGREVSVPSLGVLQAAGEEPRPVPELTFVPVLRATDEGVRGPHPRLLTIPPMQVSLRTWQGARRGRRASVMAALTPETVYIQDVWEFRSVPLGNISIERRWEGDVLSLTLGPDAPAERLVLSFASRADAERWAREVRSAQEQLPDDVHPVTRQPATPM